VLGPVFRPDLKEVVEALVGWPAALGFLVVAAGVLVAVWYVGRVETGAPAPEGRAGTHPLPAAVVPKDLTPRRLRDARGVKGESRRRDLSAIKQPQ
jgi:hypothetical protein